MAGGPSLLHAVQHGVSVAVQPYLSDALDVLRRLPLLPQLAAGSAEVMGQPGGESPFQGLPVGIGDHKNVAGAALLGHDRHQSVSTEPDRRQPNVFGHRVKVPAGSEIVKTPCRALSC